MVLPPQEVKRRSRKMAELSRRISFKKNKAWTNWEGTVIFDEKGKGNSWVGRNFTYKPTVTKTSKILRGKFLKVRVVNAFPTYLQTEVV
jgi:tRNA A37 methylthiotransferase MiaB